MVTKEEIIKLADLARIKLTPEEIEKLTLEVDSILDYVGQIQEVSGEVESKVPDLRNVMREDIVTNQKDEYTEKILETPLQLKADMLR